MWQNNVKQALRPLTCKPCMVHINYLCEPLSFISFYAVKNISVRMYGTS